MRCIDVTQLYPPRMAPVCLRGRVGCPIVHEAPARPVIVDEREDAWAHRASDEFEGCVE